MAASKRPKWLTSDQQRVWRSFLLGNARLFERLDHDLRKFGIDLPEYEILVAVSEAPEGRLRMSELADKVHQSRSRLTHTVTRMEKLDLVIRTTFPSDRRGVWAELTDQGLELLKTAAPDHVAAVRRNFVEAVSPEDYAAVGRVFEAILAVEPDPGSR